MPELQARRKKNLRALIKQWDGPTHLAKKLHYSGPSFLSQLIGPSKPITEKTARFIEKTVDLPEGWLDLDHPAAHNHNETPAKIDTSLVGRVMLSVGGALEDAGLRLSNARMAKLVSFVYEATAVKGEVDDDFIERLVDLLKGD
jgi:hypothetical protein